MGLEKNKYRLNLLTGKFDLITLDNHSYTLIPFGKTGRVRQNQQMLVNGHVTVLGHLTVNGELIDISNRQSEQFFYDLIPINDVVVVETNRLLLYKDHITVLGHLRVNGRLASA